MRPFLLWLNILAPVWAIVLAFSGHWPLAVASLLPGHALLLYATLQPACNWLGPIVTTINIAENKVVLTFDDGPDEIDTPYILDQLNLYKARAIFFLIGNRAARHPDLVCRILAEGHQIGNHTQTHPQASFWSLGPARLQKEIGDCQTTLNAITGHSPTLFRPPVGHHNPFLHPVLAKFGLPLIGWSARGLDGVSASPEAVLARLLPRIEAGAIILLHEGPRMADGTPLITRTLPAVLARLQERGLSATLPDFSKP